MVVYANRIRKGHLRRCRTRAGVAALEAVLATAIMLAVFACWCLASSQDERDARLLHELKSQVQHGDQRH